MPGVASDARFFEVPVKNATVGWFGPLAFIELLGVSQSIDSFDIRSISSPCMQLLEVCYPETHMAWGWSANPDWTTRASRTDVVFSDSWGWGWGGDATKDVPFEIRFDFGGLISQAEWIKFMALFYNEEAQAEHIFEQVKADYNALKAIGDQLRIDASTEYNGAQPKVMFVSQGVVFNEVTNHVMNPVYMTELIAGAGAQVVPLPTVTPTGCRFTEDTDAARTMSCESPAGDAAFIALRLGNRRLLSASLRPSKLPRFRHDLQRHPRSGSGSGAKPAEHLPPRWAGQ
ncbi:unnamed protein product [Symbiodinium sp. CCMP2456]|nr:unnamed protein product [Symbiodinium sp. CCMP2456]